MKRIIIFSYTGALSMRTILKIEYFIYQRNIIIIKVFRMTKKTVCVESFFWDFLSVLFGRIIVQDRNEASERERVGIIQLETTWKVN